MIDENDILRHRQGCDFCGSPGEKPGRLLCIIPYHHELVVKLVEKSFKPFSELFASPCLRIPVLPVQPAWNFQIDIGDTEEILPYLSTEIASKHNAVVVYPARSRAPVHYDRL